MKAVFQYSLLQYRHSQALGEVLNVGVLVLFPVQKQVRFLFPERLTRLKSLYRNVPEKTLRAYFKTFLKRAEQLNRQPELFDDYEQNPQTFIHREFLAADASALVFAPVKTSVLYTESLNKITEALYQQYLSLYDPVEEVERHDDQYLKTNYKNKVKRLLQSVTPRRTFQENYVIEPEQAQHTVAPARFDFGWQNHALHLVKTVSFDLQQGQSIQTKAYNNFAEFTLLDEYAQRETIQFDVLVAAPRERSLQEYYERALDVLHRPKSVRIISEEHLEEYAYQTVEALQED
ncbi:hypothetical protein GCM10023189_39060 [Nibrella saemangeumensis]|uniref:DUF3037 domain-containing protein n=1 Tax=Nibrella saemangeumensis TaxID=1084526 RepID=A0ABP8NAN3_9BACT